MANVARGKKILETWGKAAEVTNGNVTAYDYHTGFSYADWPCTLTLDLEQVYCLRVIRFLLWDGMGKAHKPRDARVYKYRLLTSENQNEWIVHYDTGNEGFNGWQEFEFPDAISARFVRIHALWNSENKEFHIVEIEAHDAEPPKMVADVTNHRTMFTRDDTREIGDAFPISSRISTTVHELQALIDRKLIHPDLLSETINNLRVQARDIDSIERSLDSVRRQMIYQVNEELKKSSKLGRY